MTPSPPPPRAAFPPSFWMLACGWGGAVLFAVSLGYFLYAYLVRFGARIPPGDVLRPTLANLTLFSAFALHHSLFARTLLKSAVTRAVPAALERSFYAWMASALLIATCWWWQPVPGTLYVLPRWGTWVGLAAQAAGLALTAAGSRAIDVLDLAGVRPLLLARAGETAPHVPLVTSGVFKLVRHPLYFGWALFVFGAPQMTATRAVFALVSTAYLAMAIVWEERSLVRVFGPAYESYRREVRWRMLPWIY